MRIRKLVSVFFISIIIISVIALSVLGGVYLYAKKKIDFNLDEELFISNKSSTVTRLYYNSNEYEEYTPMRFDELTPLNQKKIWYSYEEIGENLKDAFISSEDRDFWSHSGVNYKRTMLAVLNEIFHFKSKFGASTITQQVIKNISGDNEKTAVRKFEEIIRANYIESKHSKKEIFELYLNIVPMGYGIEGVGLAAEYYFNKSPKELTVYEAATLAGITNAPSKYNPVTHPDECLKKRNNVLLSMKKCGRITDEVYEESIKIPLNIKEGHASFGGVNSWFTETVCDDVCKALVEEKNLSYAAARIMVYNGGLSIYTTVNPHIQAILENYFYDYENLPLECKSGMDMSMIISDTKSGDIVGIIGNAGEKQNNRALNHALIPHTPGSVLKPLALYAPLIDSKKINWATVFDDIPVSAKKNQDESYTLYPHNSPDIYNGLTTVKDALRLSKNTIAVKLYEMIGKENIFNNLKNRFDIDSLILSYKNQNGQTVSDLGSSPLALGQLTNGISLRKINEAYSVFGGNGVLKKGRTYIYVYNSEQKLVLKNDRKEERIFSKETAEIVNQLLMNVTDSGTASIITLDELVDTAGKTGTSGQSKDKLFVGYTPYFTAGIWCGYSKDGITISSLSKSHLKVWDEIMREIHLIKFSKETEPEHFSTEGLEYLPYCKDSGEIYSTNCMYDLRGLRLEYGYFTEDNKPNRICRTHVFTNNFSGFEEEIDINLFGECKGISLLNIPNRLLPCEIYVEDNKYLYNASDNEDEYTEA